MKFVSIGGFSYVYERNNLIYKLYERKNRASKELFKNEVMIMQLMNHDNIPKLVKSSYGELLIIMTKCKGMSLDKLLFNYSLTYDQKKIISIQLIKLLMYVHSVNILYLDLKPENIIVDPDTLTTYLIDFNISIINKDHNSVKRGTFGYMSPEMRFDNNYSFPTDVYSLGILLYVLFTENQSEMFGQYPIFFSSRIKKIIRLSTLHDPNKRASLEEILDMMTVKRKKWGWLFC